MSGISSSRARLTIVILGFAAIAVIVALLVRPGSDNTVGVLPDASPAGDVVASPSPLAPKVAGTQEGIPVADAPGATPPATPLVTADAIGSDVCRKGCLVRIPANEVTNRLLDDTGERPSYQSEEWLWSIVSRATVDELVDKGIPVRLVQDSRDTLYLHAVRLPEEDPDFAPVGGFGEVLDSVDFHAIVQVETVPARVTGLVNAGIWVEKLMPAVPENGKGVQAGRGPALADHDLGVLIPQVDVQSIEQPIIDLQGMSSTDGTGIGTRQYSMTGNVMTSEYAFNRLESYGLTVWYEDFLTPEGFLSTNVIGEIPGDDASAIYGVMAHLDSTAEDVGNAPGADDNATGMASAFEIARILSSYSLKHPVHIIFVNAEETAIVGSMAYARQLVTDNVPMEGVFNMDSVGSSLYGSRVVLNADETSAWMMDLLVRVNEGYGLGQDIWVRQNPAIVADDTMLRREGIESVMIARELFGQSAVHHTSNDVIENVSMPLTTQAAQLVLLALGALVQ